MYNNSRCGNFPRQIILKENKNSNIHKIFDFKIKFTYSVMAIFRCTNIFLMFIYPLNISWLDWWNDFFNIPEKSTIIILSNGFWKRGRCCNRERENTRTRHEEKEILRTCSKPPLSPSLDRLHSWNLWAPWFAFWQRQCLHQCCQSSWVVLQHGPRIWAKPES